MAVVPAAAALQVQLGDNDEREARRAAVLTPPLGVAGIALWGLIA